MKVYKVLGLMSGTSLDGLDLAYCHFWQDGNSWAFEINSAKTVAYESSLKSKLNDAIGYSATDLLELDHQYGDFLGKEAAAFINEDKLEVDLIASHGHTVHHRPDLGFTLQIGSGQQLAILSGYKVVCDFRTKDIALGGQGAPLVPIGDQAFFGNYSFCLNLGGISNVSFEQDGKRIAYDIGIANMLLNYISRKAGKEYDSGGSLARSGELNQELLDQLNSLDYYQKAIPKSTGYEWFQSEIIPLVEASSLEAADLLNTAVHHITEQISVQLKLHSGNDSKTVFITGGGAFNNYLIEMLAGKLSPLIEVIIPSNELISFKEALVFAYMGLMRVLGEVNVLSSVTGASKDSSSGNLFEP